ncbi:MAG TPA: glycoside hydrolase family 15 protein [Chthoniobacterales bacterium]|nr:glycoside hydrolase family 15 protein [Chthoniobacterales bacterium]
MNTEFQQPRPETEEAFGAPGAEPRWTQSTKEGIGTAYHTSCRLWYTISHGIIDEIYYPHVDQPNTRDLQFLITDGETFCHEERRDLEHAIDYPEKGTVLYRLTNSDRAGRYRIVKEIAADPHSSVLLMQTRFEIADEALRKKLRVFLLLAPHLKRGGWHNSATICNSDGRALMHAWREDLNLAVGCTPDFTRRSVGYVGASDGWQDLQNFKMDWEFAEARDGNIALTAELDLTQGLECTLGVAFGRTKQSAMTKLLQSLATPFAQHRETFVEQWRRASATLDLSKDTGDGGGMHRLSRCILLAHEDKTFRGAIVASMSIPWGETKGDDEIGGYHLVWPRDLVQSAIGLLASGQTETARAALIWLACLQEATGELPQNSWIHGEAYWTGLQLDEVAAPILLAWQLHKADALGLFDPWTIVSRAARYLILYGPITRQERWEEASGYSPGTLAAIIAGLVIVAEFARARRDENTARFALDYADWLSAHVEEWTVTTRGELVPGQPRHYVRITPADCEDPHATAQPDTAMLRIANGGGEYPARNVVGGDFLSLVRLGLRDPHDPIVVDSLEVIDAVIKHELPQGPCWQRYNHDGYGQHDDGAAFDGRGVGGAWPLLTGERGHYELAAGRDPLPFIKTLERFANTGGMLPEQIWFKLDLPGTRFKLGLPTGSAMPLCWAHAEYLSLVRSRADGLPFDRIAPAYERYVEKRTGSEMEMWTCTHRRARIAAGKTLRVITGRAAVIHWRASSDEGGEVTANETALGLWFADLPIAKAPAGTEIEFTLHCGGEEEERHRVSVIETKRD